MSKAPPPGFYVPAVLFFDENENLDIPSIQAHVLRLAQVCVIYQSGGNQLISHCTVGWSNRDFSPRI